MGTRATIIFKETVRPEDVRPEDVRPEDAYANTSRSRTAPLCVTVNHDGGGIELENFLGAFTEEWVHNPSTPKGNAYLVMGGKKVTGVVELSSVTGELFLRVNSKAVQKKYGIPTYSWQIMPVADSESHHEVIYTLERLYTRDEGLTHRYDGVTITLHGQQPEHFVGYRQPVTTDSELAYVNHLETLKRN
jgi:hypothetical protein